MKGSITCPEKCSLCYQVCPSHGYTKNETDIGRELYRGVDGMQHRNETGYYLSSYLGYSDSNGHRKNGASGGMATWTLETLLVTGEVDVVACVERTNNPEKFFEFKLCTAAEEIRKCGRSAYYPVETSQIIRDILENDRRYASIGLPCVCKAIRLAQDKIPKLKDRIKYVLGITCGHTCSKYFAEYLSALGGGNPHSLHEIVFRIKTPNEPASNYGMHFHSGIEKSEKSGVIRGCDGFGYAFTSGLFPILGCFFCDDVFAECADAAFMDAWLPKYAVQSEGHSIVLLRNPSLQTLISSQIGKTLNLSEIDVCTTILSQKNTIFLKRRKNYVYYREALKRGSPRPKMRESLMRPIHNPICCAIERTVYRLANITGDTWKRVDKDIEIFDSEIKQYTWRLKWYRYAAVILSPSVFSAVLRKTMKCVARLRKKAQE